ncbi:MAG: SCP2 sterol-binding domain-containing protein, partial [Thermoleophilaceae bacterium]|nr:SCP2 sterol-binding domain-containing protein [Thermoleophilaceae bacterium]
EVAGGRIRAERGEVAEPDATIDTDPGALIALVHGRRELGETLATGEIEIDGDQQAVARFLGLFPLPEPALAQVSAAR